MRYALASVLVHAAVIGGAWLLQQLDPPEDAMSAESVAVDILSVEAFNNITASTVVTEATETLISAGADAASEYVPERVELAEVEPVAAVAEALPPATAAVLEPVESAALASAAVLTAVAGTAPPIDAPMPQRIDATALAIAAAPSAAEPVEVPPETPLVPAAPGEAIEETRTASIAEALEVVPEAPPIPMPRLVRKPVVEPEPEAEQAPAEKPRDKPGDAPKEAAKKQPADKPAKAANLGNGGAADADSSASRASGGRGSKASGGSGAADAYPGLVFSKVSRAVRQPKGNYKGGEVRIMFTIDAAGRVLETSLARSSGDAKIDEAAFAAVRRAAPFPPIPEGAGKSRWSFTFPLHISN